LRLRTTGQGPGEMDRPAEPLFVLWSAARAEANLAYDDWCAAPGLDAYAVYRAAEDRADAAEADLARADADSFILA
jgi:hypothetical protein